jgi:alkylation response protein AidB-like acyl-CoA dehydrogenase
MPTTTVHWTGTDPDSERVAEAHELALLVGEDAAGHDRRNDFAHDAIATLRDRGITKLLVPEELGGGGATHAETCAVLATLAHGCPATALTLSMHTHLVGAQVWRHKRDLPAPVLKRVVEDGVVLVSTGASDWIDSNGTAAKVDGGFRVSARKSPASGAPAGDLLVTTARWDDHPDGPQVIHFAVPFAADGVSIEETWDTMGMRATGSHTVVLEDVFVPEGSVSLTRPAGVWHPFYNVIVGVAMPLIMSVYVGVAEAAVDRAITLAAKRADVSTVAPVVGRMRSRLHVAQDSVGAMVRMSDDLRFLDTLDHATAVLARKISAADAATDAVRLAMEAAGGAGYSTATGIERLYRDVHGALYHPLPASKGEPFVGRHVLGHDPVVPTPTG